MADSKLREIATHLLGECEARWTETGGLEITVDFEDGRRRTMLLDERVRLGAALVEFRCPLAAADRVDPRMALAVNAKLALGALAITDDELIFIHRTPSEDLDAAKLTSSVRRVASIADTLDASLLVP